MWAGRRRARRLRGLRKTANAIAAICVSAVILGVLGFGYGTIPALGPALDPGRGAWTSAAGGERPGSGPLNIPGLQRPVSVDFTAQGVPSVHAATDHDAFETLGYVHASFRLAEMDEERRLGEGRLAQLAGPSAVSSDKFELRLGLLRTAQQEWAQTRPSSQAGQALLAYAEGVNDYIAQTKASGNWPALFSLAGVYPGRWTPVDSLVVQGVLTQELDFTTTPLDYALLERSLGAARTMNWFPVIAPNPQSPYDTGPYRDLALTPLAPGASSTGTSTTALAATTIRSGKKDLNAPERIVAPAISTSSPGVATAAGALLAQVSALPAGQLHEYPDSNAWAANGVAVAGGGALLAGDPHLPQTLPSIWYQVALESPSLNVTGVSVPGVPGVLIGHNAQIAWSLTDVQNQATFFYAEQTSASRPGEYYWRGAWRKMQQVRYTIAVRGGHAVHLTVDITVHGPIMTQHAQTMAVDWMGNVPSPDLTALLSLDEAGNFAQFRAALAGWHAPSQNFVYADDLGNIGVISAGYYPQVAHGEPWLPLSGTGADDIVGVIPYAAVPQVYDPPGHVVATANQRPVTAAYPYYIGTSEDFFDNSYRANEIYSYLRGHFGLSQSVTGGLTEADFASLQNSLTDGLAARIVPKLLAALRVAPGGSAEQAAARLLAGWNDSMSAGSAAAALWWTFWGDYVAAVFKPWWTSAGVPVGEDHAGLALSSLPTSLTEDLDAWTERDPGNPAFSLPAGERRTAADVMREAFGAAVTHLAAKLGGAPSSWTWGRLHSREFTSLTGAAGLSYGPRAAGGDGWTVDAAYGEPTSEAGPSWRMIAQLGSATAAVPVSGEGVYPGGQSENPASPWYADQIADWWNGRYLPMPPAGGYPTGPIRWDLRP